MIVFVNLVKFLSKEDIGYVTISEHLQIMVRDVLRTGG
jgi:hypothetical protein